jgi:tetratricopeptide (TPR) repeat protein
MYYINEGNQEKAQELATIMEEKTPSSVIPFTNRRYELIKDALLLVDDSISRDDIDISQYSESDLFELGRNLLQYDKLDKAQYLLENALELNPENAGALSYLINIYERSGQNDKLEKVLEDWLLIRPKDEGARAKLEEVKKKLMN